MSLIQTFKKPFLFFVSVLAILKLYSVYPIEVKLPKNKAAYTPAVTELNEENNGTLEISVALHVKSTTEAPTIEPTATGPLGLDVRQLVELRENLKTQLNVANAFSPHEGYFKPDYRVPDIKPSATNRSIANGLLFYNNVPKCGSTSIVTLISELAALSKKFNHTLVFEGNLPPHFHIARSLSILSNIYNREDAVLSYNQHGYFINVSQFGVAEHLRPNWINVIREPKSRLLSHIQHVMFHHVKPGSVMDSNELERCFLTEDRLCSFQAEQMAICRFAGSIPECKALQVIRSDDAMVKLLKLAMYNVETTYSVVGITERMEDTLTVFESYLPLFFTGASARYKELNGSDHFHRNSGKYSHTTPVSPKTEQFLEQSLFMKYEREFYDFIMQRLEMQLQEISTKTN